MKRIVALVCVLALVLGTVLVSLYLLTEDDQQAETIAAPQRPPASEADSAGATDAPEPDLAPYYTQQVEWSGCGQGFECGWLKVPMDYDEPGGKELDIALLKVLAGDQERRVGSLVVNPGGPGAPGTEYAAQASLAFREPLRRYFDIVGFDPAAPAAATRWTASATPSWTPTWPATRTPTSRTRSRSSWTGPTGSARAAPSGPATWPTT
ncbi:hypothetical protein [Nocardioides houyundeii]|uniref:hypothetical protein n=1 Tax=Nocardioides houyundeii TaxID=2045452 RepID=UPI001F530B0F|nr:hypothetical protein [Nocardioides houyundeii]